MLIRRTKPRVPLTNSWESLVDAKDSESIAVAINQIDEKKETLKKAFDDLQSHKSLLSPSLNLSWSEIDSHFTSLHSSLLNRFHLLQSPDDVSPVNWPELRTFCEKNDGKGLGKFIIENSNSKKRASIKLELSAALRRSTNPAALVLDAVDGSKLCVSLLEALIEINAKLTNDLRERARTIAYHWKSSIGNKSLEALAFLMLVAAFELGSLFSNKEIDDYVFMISKFKEAVTVCKRIGLDRSRIEGLIEKFLDKGRIFGAVRFIYEFEMTGRFEIVSVLKTSLKNCREAAKRVKAENEAVDKELSVLRSVVKVVKERNLESEFLDEKLVGCIRELEAKKAVRKCANNTKQPQLEKKRSRDTNGPIVDYIPMPFLPNLNRSLQVNQYGLGNSTLSGVGIPMTGQYGSAPVPLPPPAIQPFYYEQQTGYGGYGLPAQCRPPFYPQ